MVYFAGQYLGPSSSHHTAWVTPAANSNRGQPEGKRRQKEKEQNDETRRKHSGLYSPRRTRQDCRRNWQWNEQRRCTLKKCLRTGLVFLLLKCDGFLMGKTCQRVIWSCLEFTHDLGNVGYYPHKWAGWPSEGSLSQGQNEKLVYGNSSLMEFYRLQFLSMLYEPRHDKTNKLRVRPAKTRISLISPLSAWRKLGSLATHWAHSKDQSDMADAQADLSLHWAHTHFVCFVMLRLILLVLWQRTSFYTRAIMLPDSENIWASSWDYGTLRPP